MNNQDADVPEDAMAKPSRLETSAGSNLLGAIEPLSVSVMSGGRPPQQPKQLITDSCKKVYSFVDHDNDHDQCFAEMDEEAPLNALDS